MNTEFTVDKQKINEFLELYSKFCRENGMKEAWVKVEDWNQHFKIKINVDVFNNAPDEDVLIFIRKAKEFEKPFLS